MRDTFERIRHEAATLWPARMPLNEVKQFLRGHTDTPWEILKPLWEERKEKHVREWRDRYGLDDARPFRMMPPEVGGSATLNGDAVTVVIGKSPPVKIISNDPERSLRVFLENYTLQPSEPLIEGEPIPLVEAPKPEHDWVLWALDVKWRASRVGIRVPTRRINKYVSRYKEGEYSSLQELEKVILDSLK